MSLIASIQASRLKDAFSQQPVRLSGTESIWHQISKSRAPILKIGEEGDDIRLGDDASSTSVTAKGKLENGGCGQSF